MVNKDPEISDILKGIYLPEDDTQLNGFFRDLGKDQERCEKLAIKIREKYIEKIDG